MGKLPTYKQWKLISEAYGNQITLGVTTPQSVGITGALQMDDEEALEEAKKKKMLDIKVSEEPDEEDEKKDKKENPFAKKGKKDKKENPFAKKKDGEKEHEEDETEEEEKEEHESGEEKKDEPPFFKKKGEAKKKKMTKEEIEHPEDKEWWGSLKTMMKFDPNHKFSSGLSEEQLIPPTNPNTGLISDEQPNVEPQEGNPEPGQPGFAPQQRIGGWFM